MQYNENSKRSTTKIMCNQNVSKPYLPDRLLNRADDLLFCRILLDHGDCHNCMSAMAQGPKTRENSAGHKTSV